MQDVLKSIWSALGLPQLWGAILTLAVFGAVFIIKLIIDQAMKKQAAEFANELQAETAQQTAKLQAELLKTVEDRKFIQSQYADIHAYSQELSDNLINAYVRLYEGESTMATGEAIAKIALEVDNDVMRPFRRYQIFLDEHTIKKIFYVHNILAQVQDNPSPDVIKSFRSLKGEFFKAISDAREGLQPERILPQKGIVDYAPYKPQGG